MNIDTRIYGYIGDGFLVCNGCAAAGVEAGHYTVRQDGGDREGGELEPLGAYSGILDRPCGEVCEDCHEYIVEPDEDHGIDEECADCGFSVEVD